MPAKLPRPLLSGVPAVPARVRVKLRMSMAHEAVALVALVVCYTLIDPCLSHLRHRRLRSYRQEHLNPLCRLSSTEATTSSTALILPSS